MPDEGIAVYVVDESIDNVNDENNLAIELLQADNRRDLAKVRFGNQGDPYDLYPCDNNRTAGKTTKPPLKLPDGRWPGITIRVSGKPGDETMYVSVEMRELN